MRVPATWDTGAFRAAVSKRFAEMVRADKQAGAACLKRFDVDPVVCEGIFKNEPGDAPKTIDQATGMRVGLREPLNSTGTSKERFINLEFAEIPNMSEPMIIGCPQ